MVPGLRKKHEGAQMVNWEDREEYVMGDALPQGAFARAEEYIESSELINPAEPLTWGGLADVYGVPIFIAPAMAISAKHVVLVPMKAVREADKGAGEPRMGRRSKSGGRVDGGGLMVDGKNSEASEGDGDSGLSTIDDEPSTGSGSGLSTLNSQPSTPAFIYDLERWKRLLAGLLSKPDAIRADGPWKPLMRMQWDALREVLPPDVYGVMKAELNRDENERRRGLRWCFLALAALALCEGNAEVMEEALAECEGALGVTALRAE
jgi:hypothetical protein